MKIAILANSQQKEELLSQGVLEGTELLWVNEITGLVDADAYIDLLFENEKTRIDYLKKIQGPVIVSSVIAAAENLPANFIRINGWPTFLKRSIVEAAYVSDAFRVSDTFEDIFSCFNKRTEWTPDIPGFVTARVIATIINEAYFTLEENVSTKNEIDTAMKLGTNYPYGPFEWSEKIGLKNVYALLAELMKTNSRYKPNDLLKKEALQ